MEKLRSALADLDVTALIYVASPKRKVVSDYRGLTNRASLHVFERLESSHCPVLDHLRSADSLYRFTGIPDLELNNATEPSVLLQKQKRLIQGHSYKDKIRQLLIDLCNKQQIPLTPTQRPSGTFIPNTI